MELSLKERLARERLCLALDKIENFDDLKAIIEELTPFFGIFKIGKGCFTRFGPGSIELVHSFGSKVFLDLKYHDKPETVEDASYAATKLGVYIFDVHASGGLKMLKAALSGAKTASEKYALPMPKIVGVTVLTSINKETLNGDLKIHGKIEEQVLHLARLVCDAGLDGIVCSAADLHAIKNKLPKNFTYVTPGIRGLKTSAGQDQERIMAPGAAISEGSTIIVVGTAILSQKTSELRAQACRDILKDMAEHL